MTDEEFEQEVYYFQEALLRASTQVRPNLGVTYEDVVPEVITRFLALSEQNRPRFLELCGALLSPRTRHEIRVGATELISYYRHEDAVLASALASIALKEKRMTEDALHALWAVKTLRVLPQIFVLAEGGYSSALYMLRRFPQSSKQIERSIKVARQFIVADDYLLREAALFLLQKYSTMEQEWESVLAAVYKYKDELFIAALRKAPPECVLESLKVLRDRTDVSSYQHDDLSRTIKVLEQKQSEGNRKGEAG